MSVIEFQNDDDGYVQWQHEHGHDGFVVALYADRDPARGCLHRADCDHVQYQQGVQGQPLTANPKICSTRRGELRRYHSHACLACDPGP